MRLKNVVFFTGVMMFLIGACCIDSSLKVGAILCLSGVAIGFIGDKFFY